MLRRRSVFLTAGTLSLLFLAGCKDALSQQADIEVLEAVMFAIYGVEGTSLTQANDSTWKKRVTADAIEFQRSDFNETTETVVRRNESIRQVDRCVFRREYRTDVEKLDSPKLISRISKSETINLREASRFEAKFDGGV